MIQDARYTSPSGKEATFFWESAKRSTELKTGVYTFPGRDGAHVQHQGAGARTFPLVCIFSGKDYMEKADEFEAMLTERGIAELQHPVYGTVKVVPTGHIEREDDTVNKLGESTVTITFTETMAGMEAVELNEAAAEAIEEKFEDFAEAAASDFAEALDIGNTTAQTGISSAPAADNITTQMDTTSVLETQTQSIIDNLEPLASADKKTFTDWSASARELKDNIKKLYSKANGAAGKVESVYTKALNIGRLTLRLMRLPSSIAVSLAEKIKGYSTLTANLINQYKNDPFGIDKIKTAYAAAALALTGAAAAISSGSALTVAEIAALTGAAPVSPSRAGRAAASGSSSPVSPPAARGTQPADRSAGTMSREEAVEAANKAAENLETVIMFQDSKIAQNAFVDAAPEAHIALFELVYESIQLILNAAFALPMQKTITLDRDRQAVELCAELYGTTDCLDEFIMENNFNIDEIELLPMGKKVSYYVKST
jgi:prophage DNA circulation protein